MTDPHLTARLAPEAWVILTSALAAAACGSVGCYLVLRRISLLGDAISHAVLPGIVVAFFVAGRATIPVLIGAGLTGLVATFIIASLERSGAVHKDASIGVTFTALFALGVLGIAWKGDQVDLDLECVLFGEVGYVWLDPLIVHVSGVRLDLGPRATVTLLAVLVLNLAFIRVLWKELLVASFDPATARALGISADLIHYLLMAVVSITVVAAFESTGSIIVVAMLIVPGATAYLLTDRLWAMIAGSQVVAALSAVLGYGLARAVDGSVSGAVATVGGGLFILALLFSPRQGIATRYAIRARLRLKIGLENLLGELLRHHERGDAEADAGALARKLALSPLVFGVVLRRAERRGLVERAREGLRLLAKGWDEASRIRAAHREWQSELESLGYDRPHAHASAHRLEHVASPTALRREGGTETEAPGAGERP